MIDIEKVVMESLQSITMLLDERAGTKTEDIRESVARYEVVRIYPRSGQVVVLAKEHDTGHYFLVQWLGTTGVCDVKAFELLDEDKIDFAERSK